MGVTPRRRTFAVAALAAITAIGGLTACTKKSDEPSTPGEIKLVVDTFGEFGYDDLVKQYESSHPGIKIELRKTAQLGDYRPKLVRYLATNKGAGDVTALEEGIITEFKANAANWVDLSQYVGFASDRDAVSALWPTWDKFIEVGQQYRTKTGKGLLDTVTTAFSASLSQVGGDLFYDKDFNVVADTSPAVKQSWDLALKLADAKITAKTNTWSAEWQAVFQQGTFAATLCPSWMLGIIEQNSGAANKGKWDVAAVPGGGGNWGGSWLSVPTQSKHPKEAAELAAFLTNADSQVAAFKAKGPLPSNLKALDNADFQAYQNPYFNNAPVGKIFGEGAKTLKPVTIGPKHSSVKERAFEPALQAYEAGRLSAQAAWDQAIKDAKVQGAF